MKDEVKGIIQLILVVVFIAGSFAASQALQSSKPSANKNGNGDKRDLIVTTETIAPGPYRITFETTGTVEARSTVDIVSEVSGRITEINENFFTGGTFKTNETLFQIDPRDFELEVERLEAEVARARTAFNLEEAERDAALQEWKLINGGKKAPPLVARKPQMDEAWANLKAAKAQLENAKLDLERTKFFLPFDGRVLSSALEIGQYVTAGQSYGTVFDLKSLEIRGSLKDKQLEWLLGAEKADITISATYLGQKREYKGVLKRSASELDAQTRFASINFGFADNEAPDLVPGVFVDVKISGANLQDIAVIPPSAWQKEGVIWVLQPDNTITSITPEIIYGTAESIAIRGLKSAAQVVTSRVSGATNGMSAKTQNQANAEAAKEATASDQTPDDNAKTGE